LFEIFNKRKKGKALNIIEKDDDNIYYLVKDTGNKDNSVSSNIPA